MERQLFIRVSQCVVRWFGQVERMDVEAMVKMVIISDVEGNRCRGRPMLGWVDGEWLDGFRREEYVNGAG